MNVSVPAVRGPILGLSRRLRRYSVVGLSLACVTAAAATDYDEGVSGDLSTDPAAPTFIDFGVGANAMTGTVSDSAAVDGDRDFITFTIPAGQELIGLMLMNHAPDNLGFIAFNAGTTGFIPGIDTNSEFLAGIHIDQSLVGTDLMPLFVSSSITTNSLAEPKLEAGDYTFVIQQTSPIVQDYSLGFMVEPIGGLATGPQLIQFRSIDFEDGLIEVHNFGDTAVDLTGWRFCSHDTDQERRYTSAGGLNGRTLAAGASFVVHFNNDAPGGDPDAVNRSDLGNFAVPLDTDGYGLQFFSPNAGGTVMFGDSSLISDALQWNIPGMATGTADFRTDQAVKVGLWTDIDEYIETSLDVTKITLLDEDGGLLHGPASYEASLPCPADINGNGATDFSDIVSVLAAFGSSCAGCAEDVNMDGDVGFADLVAVLAAFGPCPTI